MAKIKKVTLIFDEADLTDVVEFHVYYDQSPITELSPFIVVPVVAEQTVYPLILPDAVPVGEGTYNLGVIAVDDAGNESDMDTLTRFFDFTPPGKPSWRK
jgi:hypothetical protein